MATHPNQWVMEDFEDWIDHNHPKSNVAYAGSLAGNTTTTLRETAPISATKKAEDAWMSWQHGKQDPTLYPILENDGDYTDWIINITRQFKSKRCNRVIDSSFLDNMVVGNVNIALYNVRKNHVSIVLERVLQIIDGLRLSRKHCNAPCEIWRLHESLSLQLAV